MFRRSAFSVIELLVVVAIISIAAVSSYAIFFESNKKQALDKDVMIVVGLLERARSLTLASKGNVQYGVHIGNDRLVMFRGMTYSANDASNFVETLNTHVQVSSYALVGGAQEILFERLTGKVSAHGTITLSLVSDAAITKTITIHATGLIESE